MVRSKRARRTAIGAGLALVLCAGQAQAFKTSIAPYAVPTSGSPYQTEALLSVGDLLPETSDPSLTYQMVGIPDGLGSYRHGNEITLFMNHEFRQTVTSRPVVEAPLNRGAFVSRLVLDRNGDVRSGERAADWIYPEGTVPGPAVLPAPQEDNTTPAIVRLCSGSLAYKDAGFDRPIYLAGEESEGSATFDGKGGLNFAFFDDEAHALPWLGRYAKENTLVMPHTGKKTVIMGLEDGPRTPDSQLYLYVGEKDKKSSDVLARNGLRDGDLFVFAGDDAGMNSEATFATGTTSGHWVEVPDAASLTDTELESAADTAGAFGFVRVEDGAFSKKEKDEFYFVTTGESDPAGINDLGRLYSLKLGKDGDPTAPALLNVVYNADHVIAGGGDIAISPDNLDVSKDFLMIQEDGTTPSRAVMRAKGRDGSIWRFDLNSGGDWLDRIDVASASRIAALDPPGRDEVAVGPGVWETSGIIDADDLLHGKDVWFFDVQAHGPTAAPAPDTVEDGQLLMMWLAK